MRLHIGCGTWILDGCVNIDLIERSGVDIVADFRTLHFEDIEEIQARHLLEHFDRKEGLEVLKLWHSWLRTGGTLLVETPDFKRICELFAVPQEKYWANREWLVRSAYGSQEAEWAYHKDGYWKEKFEEILPRLGFEIVDIKQKHNYVRYGPNRTRYRLPSIRVVAVKL